MESINNLREMVKTAQSLRLKMAEEKRADLGLLGGGIGAYQSPEGNKFEGGGRGWIKGVGTELGAGLGGIAALATRHPARFAHPISIILGLLAGGYLGNKATGAMLGKPSWEVNAPQPPVAADGQPFSSSLSSWLKTLGGSIGDKTPAAELGRITGQK